MREGLDHQNAVIEGYSQRRIGDCAFPAVMLIESTRGCPYDCVMCIVPEQWGRRSLDISEDVLSRVVPYFRYLEILGIHGDGEPLLSRNLARFVEASAENHCYLHMNSTGFYLSRRITDLLVQADLSIRFSIHAGTPETYRKIMRHDLKRVTANLEYLVNRSQGTRRRHDLRLSFLVMKETVGEIPSFLRFAKDVGIPRVRFMALRPNSKTLRGLRRPGEEFRFWHFVQFSRTVQRQFAEQASDMAALANDLGVSIEVGNMAGPVELASHAQEIFHKVSMKLSEGYSPLPFQRRAGSCVAPWLGQVRVLQNGDVLLCCSTSYRLGNLLNEDFDRIWNGVRMQEIRKAFAKGMFPRACGYCRGIKADEYPGDLFARLLRDETREPIG
jgi:MoaA/NifB/PqqE/SkfB family radical SAM enzyme